MSVLATRHPCPTCGLAHYPPTPAAVCVCGHLDISHDSNGGRRKHAPCTVWTDLDTNPTQCPCQQFADKEPA